MLKSKLHSDIRASDSRSQPRKNPIKVLTVDRAGQTTASTLKNVLILGGKYNTVEVDVEYQKINISRESPFKSFLKMKRFHCALVIHCKHERVFEGTNLVRRQRRDREKDGKKRCRKQDF